MSNALEALMGMTNDQVAAYTAHPETEGHIVIGSDRFITVPESLKRIAVQHDHNVETVTFDCPRYWDNRDLSTMKIYISYKLADGTLDSYIGDNVVVDDDVIHFDWTIEDTVTNVPGAITFLVCAKKTGTDGDLENHWNSELCNSISVSAGMDCVEPVAKEHPDLITQLLERMGIVEQINVQAEEMQVLHDETLTAANEAEAAKESAIEAQTKVEESAEEIRNLYSNAIVGTASGEIVQVNDVSPIKHAVKVEARSKNLLNTYTELETKTIDGITFVFNGDGTVTIDGTCDCSNSTNAAATRGFIPGDGAINIKKGTTVTLSGIYGITPDGKYAVRIRLFTDTKTTNTNGGLQGDYYQTTTVTVTEDCVIQSGHIQVIDGYSVDNMIIKPQLEIGDTATEFTPYTEVDDVEPVICGKNLLRYPYSQTTKEYNGVTFTDNGDGTITVNGTPTENASITLLGVNHDRLYLPAGKLFSFHGGVAASTSEEFYAFIAYDNGTADTVGSVSYVYDYGRTGGKSFILTEDSYLYSAGIVVRSGHEFKNVVFKPQLELSEVPTDYEPYIGSTDLTSVSPTMTVMSNKAGVILDIEYNKDINCVFDEINSLLELLLNGGA